MNVAALSAIYPGYLQGQDQLLNIRSKALEIQKMQSALDEQKRQFAADAAIVNNLGNFNLGGDQSQGGGAPGQAPAMPPGVSSPSSSGPSASAAGSAVPVTSAGPVAPQGGPPGVIPPGGGQSPLGGLAGLGGAPGASPAGGQAGVSQDTFSPQGELQMFQRIAMQIKARNPGIDNQTLFQATRDMIEQMKGLAGAERPYVQVMGQATGLERTREQQEGATGRTVLQQEGATGRERDIQAHADARQVARDDTQNRNTDARIDAQEKIAQDRLDALEANTETRAQAKVLRDRLSEANQTLSNAKDFRNQLSKQPSTTPQQYAAAQQSVVAAQNAVDNAHREILAADTTRAAGPSATAPAAPAKPGQASILKTPPAKAGPIKQSAAGGRRRAALPSDLPDPKGIPEGTKARDDKGNVVAVIQGGQWVSP